jgi:hypothetical protein
MQGQSADAVSFVAFFSRWAKVQGWVVPDLHIEVCRWLVEEQAHERVLMVFRGAAKSTIYAVYKAWKLWRRRSSRSLVWSADGPTAAMLTADTINVLRNHPWCRGMLPTKPGAKRFWVNGAKDARNPSMRAVGVDSNATGARADDVDFDDIEVPGNIETPEARMKLRHRISESTHIAVPGAQMTYIGTPHTHDSIYPELIASGAAVLKIPLFAHAVRYTKTGTRKRYEFPHPVGPDGLYVMAGIHEGARMLVAGVDYVFEGGEVVFNKPPGMVVDICSKCVWPDRFTREEIGKRRKKIRTLNAWDSQYMLEAKPLSEVRLDPEKLKAYDVEPVVRSANGGISMQLGLARIVGAACRWDPSSGKLKSDASSLAVVLQDEQGRRYWHRAVRLKGEIAETDDSGKKITGGQVKQIVDIVKELHLPRVVVETNGVGAFAPAFLRTAFKQARLQCGVTEEPQATNKNKRILEAIEGPLNSGQLWAHVSVLDSPAYTQMRDWNPAIQNQPDDDLDSLAGAIAETPERVQRGAGQDAQESKGWKPPQQAREDWRPETGVHEVELEG